MPKYSAKIYTGDYYARQMAANADDAICYFEQHFNSTSSPTADYACVVVATNASEKSLTWGREYVQKIAQAFGTRVMPGETGGLLIGGYQGRGNFNLKYTAMPAILGEPLFVSNPDQAPEVQSPEGRQLLAEVLVQTIQEMFPNGGLVAFSIGHKYKTSNPDDEGSPVYGPDPDPNDGLDDTEGDYAEDVLKRAVVLLEEIE